MRCFGRNFGRHLPTKGAITEIYRMQDDHDFASSLSRRAWLGQAAAASAVMIAAPFNPAHAQLRVEVSGAGATQMPFSIAPFRDNGLVPQDMAAIVRADLERSGEFRFVPPLGERLDEMSRPDLAPWRARGIDALLTGSVSRLPDGRFDVRFRLWDVVRGQDLGAMSYPVTARDLRQAAHRIADYMYEKLTGVKGVFSTRITYISKQPNIHRLWVADADGETAQEVFRSGQPLISPDWSPNGNQLLYVSFESRKPVIYAHEIYTARRRLLANFRGSNSAPAWAPDGSYVLAALSLSGNTQIYAINLNGGQPRRISNSGGIDTEPAFSGDGRHVYFVSDRGGSPQIYRMDANGGGVERITFQGTYNVSPAPSPDGRWLAYISRIDGAFRLQLMDLSTGSVTALTDTTDDESPSFAPNSRLIIYSTRDARGEALMTTTVDGRVKTRLAAVQGEIREPDWGPFLT
jgi:TolB protein